MPLSVQVDIILKKGKGGFILNSLILGCCAFIVLLIYCAYFKKKSMKLIEMIVVLSIVDWFNYQIQTNQKKKYDYI